MDTDSAHKLWQYCRNSESTLSRSALIREISLTFMNREAGKKNPDLSAITLLCEIAFLEKNMRTRELAVTSLYKDIIEVLCDDFSSQGVSVCNLVLLHMIDFIRQKEEAANFDSLLNNLEFFNSPLFLERYIKIKNCDKVDSSAREKIKKFIILSRVTVGADVAITSIIVHRLLKQFPQAQFILAGPSHLPEIFHGLPNVQWCKFQYQRDGGLIGRLTCWISLYNLLQMEWRGYESGQVAVIDPDSRLCQLGLLPLLENDSSYYYFASREDQKQQDLRLSELTNKWIDKVFGEEKNILPQVSIRPAHQRNVTKFLSQFTDGQKRIVINLGVGNEARKRLPDPFEEMLLYRLLQDKKTIVILDSGCHPEERERARFLMKSMKHKGIATAALSEKHLNRQPLPLQHGLVCLQGGIGLLSALIDQADVFFGYDSCCQHLATARRTKSVICFAGAANDRFFCRWKPLDNAGLTTTIRIQDASSLSILQLNNLSEKFAETILESPSMTDTKNSNRPN
ncbi:MAG: hypothetical protein KQH63_05145 [Desulfobulbaceae bacterium]|nr:hypothetical protein [Desulfobulbaceae bacterium]